MRYAKDFIMSTWEEWIEEYKRSFIEDEFSDIEASWATMYLIEDAELMKVWKGCDSIEDFINNVKSNPETKFCKLMVYIFGKNDWYYRRAFCGRYAIKSFHTESDIGSLKIGTEDHYVLISNHYGDTYKNRVFVFDDKMYDMVSNFFSRRDCSICGKFNVYDYDCGEDVVYSENGFCTIFSDERFFALVVNKERSR